MRIFIQGLDDYHTRYLMSRYNITNLVLNTLGKRLKALPRNNRTRLYDICYSFAGEVLKILHQHHTIRKNHILTPSTCQKLVEFVEKELQEN